MKVASQTRAGLVCPQCLQVYGLTGMGWEEIVFISPHETAYYIQEPPVARNPVLNLGKFACAAAELAGNPAGLGHGRCAAIKVMERVGDTSCR